MAEYEAVSDREVLLNYYNELLSQNKINACKRRKVSTDEAESSTLGNNSLLSAEIRNTESSLDSPSSSPSAGDQSDVENSPAKVIHPTEVINHNEVIPPTEVTNHTEVISPTEVITPASPSSPMSPTPLILPPTPTTPTSPLTPNPPATPSSTPSSVTENTAEDLSEVLKDVTQTPTNEQGSYPCPKCDKQFAYVGNLKRHIKMHHGEFRPYKCSLCVKRFWGNDSLEQHCKRVHSKDKPYACAHCEKKYSVCYDLQKHVRSVHGKDIDWEVTVPSKSPGPEDTGSDRRKVTGITTVHLGQLNHKCKFCNRGFATFNGLGVHLKMHFRCKVCQKGFNTEESLKTHVEKAQHQAGELDQEYVL